jgi:hypothetical protein
MKLLVLGLAAGILGFSTAASADCLETATRAIEAKGITDWKRTDPAPKLEGVYQNSQTSETLVGYQAWFRVAQCEKGYVVVNMRTSCAIMDIWDEGDCRVPGLH